MRNVMTYGEFEFIRIEHIELLKKAKTKGDYLVVALAGDNLGSWGRDEVQRQAILKALRFVDEVVIIQNISQLKELINTYQIQEAVLEGNHKEIAEHLEGICSISYV